MPLLLSFVAISLVVRKVLTFLALPFGICLCLLAVGLATSRRRFMAVALAILVVCSTPVVSDLLLGVLEQKHTRLSVEDCPNADAIVVLGGLVNEWRGRDLVEWSEAVDRYEGGIRLVQADKAPQIIFGGGLLRPVAAGRTEGQAMRAAALGRGVAPECIRLLPRVAVTADEANAVADLAESEGFRRIVLVTSAFHMPRAVHLFERTGLTVTPFPVDYLAPDQGGLALLDFVPQSEALWQTEIALKEFYGMAYYRLLGARR